MDLELTIQKRRLPSLPIIATAEAVPENKKCPMLETTKQDFFQEAKSLIAQHFERINENKVQGTSINVFKNKHQKPKSVKYIPLETKPEILDVLQQHRPALRNTHFPKELSRGEHFKEPSQQQTSFNIKEKYQPIDLFTKKQVKLAKIMTDIESVSKKMEKEKQHCSGKPRILEPLPALSTHPGLPLPCTTSSTGLLRQPDRVLCDWRGIVSTRSFRSRHDTVQSISGSSAQFQDYCTKTFKKKELQPEPKPEPRIKTIQRKLDSKVKRIGPHIEIFQAFQERRLKITRKILKLITILQAFVRGWLERKRFQRIMIKALHHGPNLRATINMYRKTIHRVRHRLGLWRTRQVITFPELEEWMDRKKFYETMFAKREDWQGLERSELLKYFNDCGHFPTQKQIDDHWNLLHGDRQGKYSEVITKSNAIEMLFTLYPPQGAHVQSNRQLRSTWLRPIVNGEEGYKYIVNGHPILKRANIRIVGKLVAKSIRERKMKQYFKS